MSTCATCKHWNTEHPAYEARGFGQCDAVPPFWDASEWSEAGGARVLKQEYASTTAFAQDGSDYMAILWTKPEHGCTMHEQGKTP